VPARYVTSRCRLLLPDPVFRKTSLLIALCACFVFGEGCTRPRQQVWVEPIFDHEISPQPPRVGPVTITVSLKQFSGKAFTGAQLKMEGNMSHAGMAPVFAEAKEIEPGRYQSVLQLSMAGDWKVTTHVTSAGEPKMDYTFEINGVEP
jgi:YtkA-like protein